MRCILKLYEFMLVALFTAARLASVEPRTFNPNEKANNMHVFIPAGKFTS
jgi:hypothetical protein